MKGIKQNTVTYKDAINATAEYLYNSKANVFDASVVIANIFDVHKMIVMDDVIDSLSDFADINNE